MESANYAYFYCLASAQVTTFSAVTAHALEPIEGGMLFLAQNIFLSLIAVIVVLPLARKVIPVRT